MAGDDFARTSLAAAEAIIHREKIVLRGAFFLLSGLAVASLGGAAATFVGAAGGDVERLVLGAVLLGTSGILAFAAVAGTVVRVVVTRDEIVLQAGVRAETRIPLAGVVGAAAVPFDAEARRRWAAEGHAGFAAVRRSRPVVRIEWRDAGGVEHVAFVTSDAPDALVATVRRSADAARAGAGAGGAATSWQSGSVDAVAESPRGGGSRSGASGRR